MDYSYPIGRDDDATAEARQAFWDNERDLVREGKGTRDWTIEEQREIMNLNKRTGEECLHAGTPLDADGNKYVVHHMRSIKESPYEQGDIDNLQALTRDEHKDAHFDGKYQIETNGYYDPESRKTTHFGAGEPTKPVIELSDKYIETDEYYNKTKGQPSDNKIWDDVYDKSNANSGGSSAGAGTTTTNNNNKGQDM